MHWLIYIAVFGSVFAVSYSVWSLYGPGVSVLYQRYRRRRSGVLLLVTPLLEALTNFNERNIPSGSKYLATIRRRLREAGMLNRYTPAEFIAFQELLCIAAFVVGILIVLFPGTGVSESLGTGLVFLVVFSAMAALVPLMPVDGAANRRRREIIDHWPFLLDLLTISVDAGIDIVTAIRRILTHARLTALTEELVQFVNEINLGKSRAQALSDMADRINVPMVTAVLGMIAQAERLGTPLAPVLRVQAAEFRQKKSAYVEKLAMEAPVKMLLPLLACIFPAILIVLLGPVLIQYHMSQ